MDACGVARLAADVDVDLLDKRLVTQPAVDVQEVWVIGEAFRNLLHQRDAAQAGIRSHLIPEFEALPVWCALEARDVQRSNFWFVVVVIASIPRDQLFRKENSVRSTMGQALPSVDTEYTRVGGQEHQSKRRSRLASDRENAGQPISENNC